MLTLRKRRLRRSPRERKKGAHWDQGMPSLWAKWPPSSAMLCRHHPKRHQPYSGTLEGIGGNKKTLGERRRRRRQVSAQDSKNGGGRHHGHRIHVGKRGGFLEGQGTRPTPRTQYIVFGTGQKRKNTDEEEVASKKPSGGTRAILTMVLKKEVQNHQVRVLLDTGCSIPLINQRTVEKLRIPLLRHNSAIPIENFTGQPVKGAGQ